MEFTPVVAMEGFKPSNGGVKVLCLHRLATPHYNLAFYAEGQNRMGADTRIGLVLYCL